MVLLTTAYELVMVSTAPRKPIKYLFIEQLHMRCSSCCDDAGVSSDLVVVRC